MIHAWDPTERPSRTLFLHVGVERMEAYSLGSPDVCSIHTNTLPLGIEGLASILDRLIYDIRQSP